MKLVIYNKENSQPIGQRNGERTLRFNRENGMIYISKAFASELGIKDIDKVQFLPMMKKIQRTGLFAKLIANKAFLSSMTKAVFVL